MMNSEEFEKLKSKLNNQWLDYYELHHFWIEKILPRNNHGCLESKSMCCFALGLVLAFEPELKDTLKYFVDLNPDPQVLVKVLGIETVNVHEKIKERKKTITSSDSKETSDSEYAEASKHLDEIRQSSSGT